jgi:hypothetical protein
MAAVSTSYFRAVSYLYLSTFSLPFIISHRFRTLSLSLSLSLMYIVLFIARVCVLVCFCVCVCVCMCPHCWSLLLNQAEIFRRSRGCPKSLSDDPLISLEVKDRKVAEGLN